MLSEDILDIVVKSMSIKTYSELSKLKSFRERFEYLKLSGRVGAETFGNDRYLNQLLYQTDRWKQTRSKVIVRDNGCDLGVDGFDIGERIIVHHMNAVTVEDVLLEKDEVFDPEYLISVSHNTHNAIHYGDSSLLITEPIVRTKNDTCPWKR